jgi:hypothetical protein
MATALPATLQTLEQGRQSRKAQPHSALKNCRLGYSPRGPGGAPSLTGFDGWTCATWSCAAATVVEK